MRSGDGDGGDGIELKVGRIDNGINDNNNNNNNSDGSNNNSNKRSTRLQPEGSEVKAVLHANQFFGETALLGNGRRSASIFARTHVTLLSMKKPAFVRLMQLLEDPSAYQ